MCGSGCFLFLPSLVVFPVSDFIGSNIDSWRMGQGGGALRCEEMGREECEVKQAVNVLLFYTVRYKIDLTSFLVRRIGTLIKHVVPCMQQSLMIFVELNPVD